VFLFVRFCLFEPSPGKWADFAQYHSTPPQLQAQRQTDLYGPRAQRVGKACAFRGLSAEAARPHWIPAIVLLREIREQDYEGGYSILTSFLLNFKSKENEAVVR